MDGFTTVAVRRTTLNRLRGFREYGRESYDETLNKIMSVVSMAKHDSEGELTEQAKKGIELGRKEIKEGKGVSTKELMKRLGVE